MSTSTLYEYLSQKLEQKRKEHPSFRLMEIDDNLFPNGVVTFDTEKIEARDSKNELKTVKEIIAESWEKGSKNHLMIEGEGGMGKTVTLLSIPIKFTPFPIPAIYIPLHELTNNDNPIEYYIKRWVLNNKEDLYRQLLDLIDKPWDKGPQIMLLLDGFNEIDANNRKIIGENIEQWSEYPGIQIVTSSRYDIRTYIELSYVRSVIKLQPLSDKTVKNFLNRIGVSIPVNNAVTNLITNPLLLTLYVKTELVLRQRETEFSDFKEVRNAGTIVWNYLQCELWRYGKDEETAKNAILVMEFIAPFIAWRMQQKSLFVLEKKEFNKCLEDAYKLLENHFNNPAVFPFHIQEALRNTNIMLPIEHIKSLLEKQICLFIKNKQKYRLMHQQFRDALAAIHLINASYCSGNSLPAEWESPVDYFVMQFVVDLISEEEAMQLWEQNRKTISVNDDTTRNQLRLQRLLHNNDFTHLDFSGLDLSNISLYPYHFGNATLKLPTRQTRMVKTKISKKTFSPEAHEDAVTAIAVTPDGKRIVSGSRDRTIRVWDMETGTSTGKPIEGHEREVTAVAVTSDRKRIVSGSRDGTIRVWDLETGAAIGNPIEGHEGWVNAIAVTKDLKHIVSGSWDRTIRVWDLENGAAIGKPIKGHEDRVTAVAVSPDGKRIVSGSDDRTIRIWNIVTGEAIGEPFEGHVGWVTDVAVTTDGKRIVSGSSDRTIRVWNIETGEAIGKPIEGHEDGVRAVAVTPDEKRIVSGSRDGTIRVWDIESGAAIGNPIEGHKFGVTAVAVTPDGKRIVSGSDDCTIRLWDLKTGTAIGNPIEGHKFVVPAVAVTPDEKRIVIVSEGYTIRVWDLKTGTAIGKPIEGHKFGVTAVAVTPDGKHIVCSSWDDSIRMWDIETGTAIGNPIERHKFGVTAVAVTPDGKRIVCSSWDGTICVWDIESGAAIGNPIKGHKGGVTAVALTPDGKRIISRSRNNIIRVGDLTTGEAIENYKDGHKLWENAVYIISNRKSIVSDDDTISITDTETREVKRIKIHPLSFVGLDFSLADISDADLKETLRQNGAKV